MAGTYVVMFDGVGNQPKGARITVNDLYHEKLPGRDQHWQRLVDLGAVKPESDDEAKAVPPAFAHSGAGPIIPGGGDQNFTSPFVPAFESLPPTVDRYMPLPAKAEKLAVEEHQPAVQGDGELKATPERATRVAR